jgi:hypothetical protein
MHITKLHRTSKDSNHHLETHVKYFLFTETEAKATPAVSPFYRRQIWHISQERTAPKALMPKRKQGHMH